MDVVARLRWAPWAALTAVSLLAGGCTGDDAAPAPGDPSAAEAPVAVQAPVMGASQVLVPDPGGDGVVLLTGPPEETVDDGPLELWRWDGETWRALEQDEPAPSARNYFAAGYDGDRGVVVLFGGDTADGTSDETWEWDGDIWQRFDVPGPPALSAAELTYDPGSRTSVLYGGNEQAGTAHGETWSWDGLRWRLLARNGPVPVRWPAGLASDHARGSVVAYGGHQVVDEALPPALGDTWAWSEGRWRGQTDAGGPGPLVNAQAIDHPQLGLLLVGGSDLERDTGDVWHWDGERWLPMAAGVFPPRQAFGLAYDAARDTIVLTGGLVEPGEPTRHQDVWEWSGDPNDKAVQVEGRPPT